MKTKQSAQLTMKQMKPGEQGIVIKVNVTGALKRRLFDMGITPGAEVVMRKTAPLGDPIEINIRGYALSVRKSEAEAVLVRLD
ncbi:MAG: ferrous iron transport protein A [Eubacteriales bacterium]